MGWNGQRAASGHRRHWNGKRHRKAFDEVGLAVVINGEHCVDLALAVEIVF